MLSQRSCDNIKSYLGLAVSLETARPNIDAILASIFGQDLSKIYNLSYYNNFTKEAMRESGQIFVSKKKNIPYNTRRLTINHFPKKN